MRLNRIFYMWIPRACPLQPGHASQGKESNRNGVGVPLERGSERTAAPAQRCHGHSETNPYLSGSEQRGRWATMPAQRKQQYLSLKSITFGELINHYLAPRASTFVKIGSPGEQLVHQELDRTELARSNCLQHEHLQIQEWLDKIQRPDGTTLKIKNVLSAIFSHEGPLGLVQRNPVCGQGRSPGHRGAATGVRQSSRISDPSGWSSPRCRSSNAGAVAVSRN